MYTREQTMKTVPFYSTQYKNQDNNAETQFNELIDKIEKTTFFSTEDKNKLLSKSVKDALFQEFKLDFTIKTKTDTYLKAFDKWGLKPYIDSANKFKMSTHNNYVSVKQKINKKIICVPYKAFLVLFPELEWNSEFFEKKEWVVCTFTSNRFDKQITKNKLLMDIINLATNTYENKMKCFLMEEK